MTNILSTNQENKHTARALKLVYDHIEERFGDSGYGINIEYDVAIKILARIHFNDPEIKDFTKKVERDINQMLVSFNK